MRNVRVGSVGAFARTVMFTGSLSKTRSLPGTVP
ncbi:MAG: hypothetical protein ACI9R3_006039, partial [Verrucomicrobiales bacterium]